MHDTCFGHITSCMQAPEFPGILEVIDEAGITVAPLSLTARARNYHHNQQQTKQQQQKQDQQLLQGVHLLPQQQYSVLILLSLIQQQQQQRMRQPGVTAAAASLGVFGQFVMVTAVVEGTVVAAAAGDAADGGSAALPSAAAASYRLASNVSLVPWQSAQEPQSPMSESEPQQQQEGMVGNSGSASTPSKAMVLLCRRVSAAIVPSLSDVKSMLRPDARPFISNSLRQLFGNSGAATVKGGFVPVPRDVQWPRFALVKKVSFWSFGAHVAGTGMDTGSCEFIRSDNASLPLKDLSSQGAKGVM